MTMNKVKEIDLIPRRQRANLIWVDGGSHVLHRYSNALYYTHTHTQCEWLYESSSCCRLSARKSYPNPDYAPAKSTQDQEASQSNNNKTQKKREKGESTEEKAAAIIRNHSIIVWRVINLLFNSLEIWNYDLWCGNLPIYRWRMMRLRYCNLRRRW